jgi:DNA-binding winged helix-turn-helix (wHTH) protein
VFGNGGGPPLAGLVVCTRASSEFRQIRAPPCGASDRCTSRGNLPNAEISRVESSSISTSARHAGHHITFEFPARRISKEVVSMVIVVCFILNVAPISSRDKHWQLARKGLPKSFQTRLEFLGISCRQLRGCEQGPYQTPRFGWILRDAISIVLESRYSTPAHLQIECSSMSASETQIGKDFYEFGSFRVDPAKQLVLHEGEPVPLTPKAFQLLLVLVSSCNEIVTKDELMKAVWPDTFVEETNLSRNIFALRKALGETEQNRFIITVPGRGYRFSEHVRLISEPELTIVAASYSKVQEQFPEDTAVRFSYLPTLRAVLALNQAQPQQAVELLQAAAPHELGIPVSAISGLFGALYPVYVRGQAYLAGNKPTEAAAEFQKVLDHRGIVVNDPIGALAHLQIGRAYAVAGDKAKAQSAYQTFLALWKEANADIPIFKQAKAEYAKLQ